MTITRVAAPAVQPEKAPATGLSRPLSRPTPGRPGPVRGGRALLTTHPVAAPTVGVPGYCAADFLGTGTEAGSAGDGPSVRLQSVVIDVPPCPRGYHGAHRVKVRIGGAGIPLAVAHGYTSHSRVYLLVLGLLARWFKVVAIDLAGHGGTAPLPRRQQRIAAYADLFLCTLEYLGIEKAVIVGHSLGGRVAAEAVSMQPARAAALILANPITGSHWDQRISRLHRNPGSVLPLIGRLLKDTTVMVAHLHTTDQAGTLLQLSRETLLTHLRTPSRLAPAGIAILTAPPSVPVLRAVGASGIPTVVIWGENDPVITLADARNTAALTNADLIIVEGSGHSWPLADRRTLPEILRSELTGKLGRALDDTVTAAGLNPATADKDDAESVFYRCDALALRHTPPLEPWHGHRQGSHRLVLWATELGKPLIHGLTVPARPQPGAQ